MSSKAKPIKKVAHEHSNHEIHKPKRSRNIRWMFISIILAAVVVASIFTNGFNFDNVKLAESSLNKILQKATNEEVKSSVNSALTSLNQAKVIIEAEKSKPIPTEFSGDKVKLDFYVMSQCPYGVQVENGVKPALDKLGKAVDFSVNFIATDNGDGTFGSLHGQNEVLGNIVQLCAMKYNPDTYMDMIICMNKDYGSIPSNWEACANENKLNVEKIKTCYESQEGKTLLSESIKKANEVGARGSPTMYINDVLYNGGRDAASFTAALCAQLENHPACADLPKPAEVNLIILNDELCEECQQYNSLATQLKGIFAGLKVTIYDYEDAEGKKLYDDLDIVYLPAFLFDETVKEGEGYSNVERYLEPVGSYYSLRVGASYNPASEICDNQVDDRDQDGLIDCEDDECKEQVVCREEMKEKIDLFVMSQCPYGTIAMDSMKEVLENFKGEIDFEMHFIATDNGDGTFSSLHGQPEVDENIRESCVMKYYPTDYKYMDYIWCRNKDISSTEWQSCATDNGMDVNKIKTCAEGEEGKELLREKIKLSNELGIGASPTWMANNKVIFSGLDAQTIKTNYCSANPELKGCDNTLTGQTASTPSGSC